MHEYSVACDIIKTVMEYSKGESVKKITLVIGDMSSVIDESVRLYWDLLAENTAMEQAELVFRRIEGRFVCRECGCEFPVRHSNFVCPDCGGQKFKITEESKSFYIESIEI